MKTWKSKRKVCRSKKSGKFVKRDLCAVFKRELIRATRGTLFDL